MKRTIALLLITAALLFGAPAVANAVPTNDTWLVKTSMNLAWHNLSSTKKAKTCIAWYSSPSYWARWWARDWASDYNVSYYWGVRFARSFFNSHC